MSQLNLLDEAIEISRKILLAIDNSELESIAHLEAERHSLISDYYSNSSKIDEQLTRQLKDLNDNILQRLNELQSKIRAQHSSLGKGSKASKAYLDNT